MNLVLSQDKIWVNGKTIPKLFGGFGPGQPSILAKQIADLHNYKLKEINQLLNNNLNWFDEGIDFLDIKSVVIGNDHDVTACLLKFYTQEGLNRSRHIYLFSQQGYAMLCKLLRSELAKKIYKEMVREYFKMAEMKSDKKYSNEIEKPKKEKEAEIYGWSGKLAELILEEMKQNRVEMNQIYLELREVKERLTTLENPNSKKEKTETSSKAKTFSPVEKLEKIETDLVITNFQANQLHEIVKSKAKTQKEMLQIWSAFKKQFKLTRYIYLPKAKFEEALKWLKTQ